MLSLKTLTENPASLRAPEPAPRPRSTDEKQHSDFHSYLAVAVEQHTPNHVEKTNEQRTETPRKEQSVAETPRAGDTITPQKAGHDDALTESDGRAQHAEKFGHEAKNTPEEKPKIATIRQGERELLEALGLIRNKNDGSSTTTGALRSAANAMAARGISTHAPKLTAVKGETPTHTLTLLEKSPDLVLMGHDGLKKLGEKLGLSLLSKVSEKLNEKNRAQENTVTANGRTEARSEVMTTMAARAQKAGERESESRAEIPAKAMRPMPARTVSRETTTTTQENLLSQNPARGEQLLGPANPEPAAARNAAIVSQGEFRLYDAASSTRPAENARTAVENPTLRPELVRQFNEIISRAQVLINDAQNAQFSVRLFPREIGRMEIDLKLIDGEIRGKIVVESEEVKSEMQNFLQNSNDNSGAEKYDLNKIDIEVRSGNRNAQNSQQPPDTEELLQNLVTRTASAVYNSVESTTLQGNALYA